MSTQIKPGNWDTAAAITVNEICSQVEQTYAESEDAETQAVLDEEAIELEIENNLDVLVDILFHSEENKIEEALIEQIFFHIACLSMRGYSLNAEKTHGNSAAIIYDTVLGKQKMYGHGNIARFEIPGIVIRLNDKLERLKNLRKWDGAVLFEPMKDTWLDICGYSVIAIMWLREWFLLNLKNQETTGKPTGAK